MEGFQNHIRPSLRDQIVCGMKIEEGETTDEEEFSLIKLKSKDSTVLETNTSIISANKYANSIHHQSDLIITTANRPPMLGTWQRESYKQRDDLFYGSIPNQTMRAKPPICPYTDKALKKHEAYEDIKINCELASIPCVNNFNSTLQQARSQKIRSWSISKKQILLSNFDEIIETSVFEDESEESAPCSDALERPALRYKSVPVGLFRKGITMSEKVNGREKRSAIKEWYSLQQKRHKALRNRSNSRSDYLFCSSPIIHRSSVNKRLRRRNSIIRLNEANFLFPRSSDKRSNACIQLDFSEFETMSDDQSNFSFTPGRPWNEYENDDIYSVNSGFMEDYFDMYHVDNAIPRKLFLD